MDGIINTMKTQWDSLFPEEKKVEPKAYTVGDSSEVTTKNLEQYFEDLKKKRGSELAYKKFLQLADMGFLENRQQAQLLLKGDLENPESQGKLFNACFNAFTENSAFAAYLISKCYKSGYVVTGDHFMSIEYLKVAARLNLYDAVYDLAVHYNDQNNLEEAAACFQELGKMCRDGIETEKNFQSADTFFYLAEQKTREFSLKASLETA